MANHYDVTVVGPQASGLIAAALLARRGRRVLLVDHGESIVSYRRNGLRLPLMPTLIPALDSAPHVRRVHEELGLGPTLRTGTVALEPSFQALMPEHRLDISSRREALIEEVRAEFPDLVGAVERFFDRLFQLDDDLTRFLEDSSPVPPAGLLETVKSRAWMSQASHLDVAFESHELLSDIPTEHPVRDVLLGPLAFFGHLDSDEPSTFHAVRLIARYFRGAVDFDDPVGGWWAMLRKAAEDAGVEVRRGAIVKGIELEGRNLTRMTLDDDSMPYTADFFVRNTLGRFRELLPAGGVHPKYVHGQDAVRPVGSLLVINLVVGRDVIPNGFARAAFLINGRRAPRGKHPIDPPLFLRRYRAENGDSAVESSSEILSVACPTPTNVVHAPDRFAGLKAQIVERVRRVVPFLDDHLVDTSLPVDTAGWDVETGWTQRRIDPLTLHPIFETSRRPILGIAARSTRTYYKNLVHCGRDVVPGLGIEGEYVTGLSAVTQLERMAGRRWKR